VAWFREWLEGGSTTDSAPRPSPGPSSRAAERPMPGGPEEFSYPGERFGLPETGPGSVATLARRGGQFALDALLAGLIAALFTYPALPQNWSLLSWAILMIVPVAVIGTTPAMVLLGMRVVRLDRPESAGVGLVWTLVRTFSVFFVIPALIIDKDSRGIHDRVSRTIVLRTR
jgi:hypothetical protein